MYLLYKWTYKVLEPYLKLPKEVYIIFLSKIVNSMGALVWPVMTFILQLKLGFTVEDSAKLLLGASVILAFPPLIGGKLADTLGKKQTIIIFDILGVTFFYICAVLPQNHLLVIFLFLASLFSSVAGPAHDALLGDLSTPETRKQAYSLSYIGWNIGYGFGAAIAGFLFKHYLWLNFVGDATTTLLSLLLIVFFVKKVNVNQENHNELEKEEEGSIFDVLFERPRLLIFAFIIMGLNFVYSQWGFLIQSNLSSIYGENGAKYYGLLGSLNAIVVIVFTAVLSLLLTYTKNFKIIIIGGLTYAVGFGLFGVYKDWFTFIKQDYIFFFIGTFIFTIGEILLALSVNPYIFNHTPASHRGRMSASLGLIMGIGWMAGPITGLMVKHFGFDDIWRGIGILAFVCSVLIYILGKYDKPIINDEDIDKIIL